MNIETLQQLSDAVREFGRARDWHLYHTPKNLTAALVVEAAELMEPFQWLTPEQSLALPPHKREAVRQEMADVLIYLVSLANQLEVDLLEAARDKLAINARKYPVDKARGSCAKYDELDDPPRIMSHYRHHLFFCLNVREDGAACCTDHDAEAMFEHAKKRAKKLGLHGKEGDCRVNRAGCFDRCAEGPVCVVYPDAVWYTYVDEKDIDEIIEEHLGHDRVVERLRLP